MPRDTASPPPRAAFSGTIPELVVVCQLINILDENIHPKSRISHGGLDLINSLPKQFLQESTLANLLHQGRVHEIFSARAARFRRRQGIDDVLNAAYFR